MRTIAPLLLASIAGGVGFSGNIKTLPFVLILPVAMKLCRNIKETYISSCCYFLVSSHGLIIGIYQFTENNIYIALTIWLASSFVLATPFILICKLKSIGLVIALALITFPPLGDIGWANPLTASGVIFSGLGYIGIALTIILIVILYIKPKILFLFLPIILLNNFNIPENKSIKGIDTLFGNKVSNDINFVNDYHVQSKIFKLITKNEKDFLVFPESAGGMWNEAARTRFESFMKHQKKTIFIGVDIWKKKECKASILLLDKNRNKIIYSARRPVPNFLWLLAGRICNSSKNSGVFAYQEKIFGALICYESVITWPVLQTHLYHPENVIVICNLWWANNTNIEAIMRMKLTAWSLLFRVPYIISINK